MFEVSPERALAHNYIWQGRQGIRPVQPSSIRELPAPSNRRLIDRVSSAPAVNCVHATSRRSRLRSASNDASNLAGSGPGIRPNARRASLVEEVRPVIRAWKDGLR